MSSLVAALDVFVSLGVAGIDPEEYLISSYTVSPIFTSLIFTRPWLTPFISPSHPTIRCFILSTNISKSHVAKLRTGASVQVKLILCPGETSPIKQFAGINEFILLFEGRSVQQLPMDNIFSDHCRTAVAHDGTSVQETNEYNLMGSWSEMIDDDISGYVPQMADDLFEHLIPEQGPFSCSNLGAQDALGSPFTRLFNTHEHEEKSWTKSTDNMDKGTSLLGDELELRRSSKAIQDVHQLKPQSRKREYPQNHQPHSRVPPFLSPPRIKRRRIEIESPQSINSGARNSLESCLEHGSSIFYTHISTKKNEEVSNFTSSINSGSFTFHSADPKTCHDTFWKTLTGAASSPEQAYASFQEQRTPDEDEAIFANSLKSTDEDDDDITAIELSCKAPSVVLAASLFVSNTDIVAKLVDFLPPRNGHTAPPPSKPYLPDSDSPHDLSGRFRSITPEPNSPFLSPSPSLSDTELPQNPYKRDRLNTPETETKPVIPFNKLSCLDRKRIAVSPDRSPWLTKAMTNWIRKTQAKLDPFRTDTECWFHPSPPPPRVSRGGAGGILRPTGNIQKSFQWTDELGRHSLVINYGICYKLVFGHMTKQQADGWVQRKWHLSHLCGNWSCLNPAHTTIEAGATNINRNSCFAHRDGCTHSPECMKEKKAALGVDGKLVPRGDGVEDRIRRAYHWEDWWGWDEVLEKIKSDFKGEKGVEWDEYPLLFGEEDEKGGGFHREWIFDEDLAADD